MTPTLVIAPVHKEIEVRTDVANAFALFTGGIDRWWPKNRRVGAGRPLAKMTIEPNEGGRWYATLDDGSEHDIGRVLIWEPPLRAVFRWEINAQWVRDPSMATEVEVRFVAEAPDRTRVELEHRGFEQHGAIEGEKMRDNVLGGWPAILALFEECSNARG
jgi:hypothetical protein